jgi:hypothetical protein
MEKRNVVYWIILGALLVALVTVGILILRKRASPVVVPIVQPSGSGTPTAKPPGSKPLDSYTPERPFQPGDPINATGDEELPFENLIQ